ncbi:MAG: hypothetical protein BWK80_10845 [Desulfobacteraceae bacterium IS3]|nr:MAG: hypothetical protein BWK80_10845 [Desulfobacteraceae bacterium IS3]
MEKVFAELAERSRETDRQFKEETDRQFKETDRQFKETDRQFKETAERFKETDRQFKETAERFKETDRQFKETDARLAKLFAEAAERSKETDRQFKEAAKEAAERSKETDRQLKETGRKIDSLGGKWGEFVEGFVAPAAERLFKERGIEINEVYQRARKRKNGKGIEIDILAVNGEYAVLIEVKSTLGVDDVKEHIGRLGKFREFFPQYAERKIVGAVAGIVIDEGADRFAYKNGLFVIAQSGESVKIMNDPDFKPKVL